MLLLFHVSCFLSERDDKMRRRGGDLPALSLQHITTKLRRD